MGEHTPWGLEFFGLGGGVSGVQRVKRSGVERMGNFVSDGRVWTLPQHGPHTSMRENRIPDSLQPSAIRFFKI